MKIKALILGLALQLPSAAQAGVCVHDAEAGAENPPIAEATSGADTYIYTTVTKLGPPPDPASGFKDFVVAVPSTGLYKIEERVYGSSIDNNSWYVEILGHPDTRGGSVEIDDILPPYDTWRTKFVMARPASGPEGGPDREWWLPVGNVTVRYHGREENARLDCFGLVVQPTYTATPTSTESSTVTSTRTPSASFTVSKTPTPSPTATLTASSSASLTPSPSSTPTAMSGIATATPPAILGVTSSPTPVAFPDKALALRVYDDHGGLVKDLGTVYVYSQALTLNVSNAPFSPERHGLLVLQAEPAGVWGWDGDKQNGSPAPNGRYTLKLAQAGGPIIETVLWLVRGEANLGAGRLFPNPVNRAPVWIQVATASRVAVEIAVYNSAGERVAGLQIPGGQSRGAWNLKGAGGKDVAAGIYLIQLHYLAHGGMREVETLKLAVVR